MDRRDFLFTAGSLLGGLSITSKSIFSAGIKNQPIYSGWIPNKQEVRNWVISRPTPYFFQHSKHIKGTGDNKLVFLWKYLEKAMGCPVEPHNQTTGDCVAHAFALGVDVLTSVQIHLHKKPEKWIAKAAVEPIYAGSRIEVGKGKIRGGGSLGVWGAQWINEWGALLRQKYGEHDLTTYSGKKSDDWGHLCNKCTLWGGGVPDELEAIAKLHPVQTTALVTTWNQACDAISNGYPVIVCSDQGFESTRDKQGFARPKGTWYHSMLLAGIDTLNPREGGLFCNSWSVWNKGPKRFNQPEGSFWADADIIHSMLQKQDSFAISNYKGYPRQDHLDYRLY